MFGAIIGDIAGSFYERRRNSTKDICAPLLVKGSKFTDDSVLTVAIADAILHGMVYGHSLKIWARRYPNAGFGRGFLDWAMKDGSSRNNSFGNGSAMRVSPIGWAFNSLEDVLREARSSAMPSHCSDEGVKAAQAVAAAVFLARKNVNKEAIRSYLSKMFAYDMNRTVNDIRPGYHFTSRAEDSVPEAIICFLDSTDFISAIHLAISLGGDADTQACIAGAIAEPYYGMSLGGLQDVPKQYLTPWLYDTAIKFHNKYCTDSWERERQPDPPERKTEFEELEGR